MSDSLFAARARGIIAVLFIAVAALLGYAVHQHYVLSRLSGENQVVVSNLKETHAEIAALTSKLDSLALQAAPQPVAPVKKAVATHKVAVRRKGSDPRFARMQNQIDAQGRAIESTRQELSSARTELQGGIARNHEELVVLQKKGERSYFEFDLDKSKQFQRTGPVAISLRKANTKHMYADLEIRVEDAQVSQKHVNLFQPVVFYTGEQGRPVELVINAIHKDHIHGYISAPRYSAAELAANSAQTDGAGAAGKPRQKLEVPRQ